VTATLPDEMPSEATVADPQGPDEPVRPSHPAPAALQPWHDPRPWVSWLVVVCLGVLAGFTRFWSLGFPNEKIFDEAYYPVEAQELLRFGYEDNRGYMFIVHPPLGKWLIGWSSDLFGNGLNSAFGWRVFPALFGCLTVVLLARIARRMFRSNLFGAIAGLLIALDGLSLVLARTAILDVFLEFFVLAAFGALLLDRDHVRSRLAGLIADGADLSAGVPTLGPRPWRLAAGVLWGLACGRSSGTAARSRPPACAGPRAPCSSAVRRTRSAPSSSPRSAPTCSPISAGSSARTAGDGTGPTTTGRAPRCTCSA
jgi:hypothetical protein